MYHYRECYDDINQRDVGTKDDDQVEPGANLIYIRRCFLFWFDAFHVPVEHAQEWIYKSSEYDLEEEDIG